MPWGAAVQGCSGYPDPALPRGADRMLSQHSQGTPGSTETLQDRQLKSLPPLMYGGNEASLPQATAGLTAVPHTRWSSSICRGFWQGDCAAAQSKAPAPCLAFPMPQGKTCAECGNAHEHRANTEKKPKPATSIVRVTCVLPGALWDDILLIPGKQISITLANF